jgi:hypothetical protein
MAVAQRAVDEVRQNGDSWTRKLQSQRANSIPRRRVTDCHLIVCNPNKENCNGKALYSNSIWGDCPMPMIWERSIDGFVRAMNAAFDAAYSAADDPRIANDPGVMAARVAAEVAQADVLKGIQAAQEAGGFFQRIKTGPALSRLSHAANIAEVNLRKTVNEALDLWVVQHLNEEPGLNVQSRSRP